MPVFQLPPVVLAASPLFGVARTWSKMAMGMARVQQALGTSTMPEMRPSQGQHDSRR